MTPLVSIIVPVYNSSKTLENCFYSILNQTYSNFELIIVDDGSTDGSGKICDYHSSYDPRVKIYHTKNSGVARARNYGINKSKGEYITFVDSDDYIDKDYLNHMVKNITTSFLICKRYQLFNGVYKTTTDTLNCIKLKRPYTISTLYKQYDMFSPFNKLFSRNIIFDNNIKFPTNLNYGEDGVFVSIYIKHIKELECLDYHGYYYNRWENNSLSSTIRKDVINELILSRELVYNNIKNIIKNEDITEFEDYIKNEEVLGLSLFLSKSFYTKKIKLKKRLLLIKGIESNPLFKVSIKQRKKYYQGILYFVMFFRLPTIQYAIFVPIHFLNTVIRPHKRSKKTND